MKTLTDAFQLVVITMILGIFVGLGAAVVLMIIGTIFYAVLETVFKTYKELRNKNGN